MAVALALAGYLLLLLSNPIRKSLLDGWRCIRKYPTIWVTLAWLGCTNALFHLIIRCIFQMRGMDNMTWFRPQIGQGTPLIWSMSAGEVRQSIENAWIPALEALAGLFNNAISTFPVAVFAAAGFLFNRHGHFRILRTTLKRRFGWMHWLLIAAVVISAIASIAKAGFYLRPSGLPDDTWFQWAPVVVLLASIWEYLFGLAIQLYLILHAFAWVRGITFNADAMREVTIRRFASGVKWAGLVILLGLFLIEVPLVLKNFPAWQGIFPNDTSIVESRLKWARGTIAVLLIGCASMQAWLGLHGETMSRAWHAHWQLWRNHSVALSWFIIIAAIHLWLMSFCRSWVLIGLGPDTMPGLAWTLIWPWGAGVVSSWLLATWVCVFKNCER